MLLESSLFTICLIVYSLSMLAYFTFFILRKNPYYILARGLLCLGFISHTAALLTRSAAANYIPVTNQYEFATSFAWGIVLCFIAFDWKYRVKLLGAFVTPLILVVAFYASLQSREIRPLMPVLQSNWITVHVITAIFSYGAFAVACALSLMFIMTDRFKHDGFIMRHMPGFKTLDTLSYRTIALGFIMLTVVIITGAIWADKAWGRYWQWDPKETWSFITWIVYAIYLHVRLNRGWRGKKAAWFAIIGFASILFTYIGVNTLLSGYHSYGSIVIQRCL